MRSPRWMRWAPELVLLGSAILLAALGRWRWVHTLGDNGVWFSDVQSMLAGRRVVFDVFLNYGPGSVLFLHWATRCLGVSVRTVAAVELAVGVLATILTLRFSRRFLRDRERLVVALLLAGLILYMPSSGSLIFPYAPAVPLAIVLVVLSLEAGLDAVEPASLRRVAAGLLIGAAYLTKQEIGLAGLAALAIGVAILAGGQRRRLTVAVPVATAIGAVALGYAAVFRGLPFARYSRLNRLWPFAAVPRSTIALYGTLTGYADPAGCVIRVAVGLAIVLGALGALASGCGALQRRPILARRGVLLVAASLPLLLVGAFLPVLPGDVRFPVLAVLPVSIVFGLIAGLRCRDARRRAAWVALATAAGLLLLRAGTRGWTRGPYAGLGYCLAVPLLVASITRAAMILSLSSRTRRALWAAATAVLGAVSLAYGGGRLVRLERIWDRAKPLSTPRGTVWMPPPWVACFERLGRDLELFTRPGDRIAVLPETYGVDFLFDRTSASPWPNLYPGSMDAELEEEILRRWSAAPPRGIVLFEPPYREFGGRQFGRDYGIRLFGWVRERFVPVDSSGPGEAPVSYWAPRRIPGTSAR